MAEVYDFVVIGAGHNGLASALHLARAGFSVLVAESRDRAGGCAATLEPLLPGFRHSPHANTFIFADLMPDELAPAALMVSLHHPEAQLGVAFADGRPPVILHRPDCIERTKSSFAAYSRKDAAAYAGLKACSASLGPLIREGLYNAPSRTWFAEQVEGVRTAFKGRVDARALGEGSARSLIDELFEAPEVRVLLYHLATETGLSLQERGSDIAFLGYSLWIAGRWRIPVGGMGAYADALRQQAEAAGVRIACSAHVARVVIEDGRAAGIETASGNVIRAARGVIAATPILETYDRLVAPAYLSRTEREELSEFRAQQLRSVGTSLFCLEQAPRYRSARYDPQIDTCLKTVIGHETPADVIGHDEDLRAGLLPKPAGVVRLHSLWDPSQAPQGRHCAAVDSSFPAPGCLDQDTWKLVEAAFPQAFFDAWSAHCLDDLAPALAMSSDLSSDFERRMLLRMGPDQYRTSVGGLYLAGPGVYPGGGVHGACGRNAANTALGDIKSAS